MLRRVMLTIGTIRLWKDTEGQDILEYALIAAFLTVAAAAVTPTVSGSISTIFSKVVSVLSSTPS